MHKTNLGPAAALALSLIVSLGIAGCSSSSSGKHGGAGGNGGGGGNSPDDGGIGGSAGAIGGGVSETGGASTGVGGKGTGGATVGGAGSTGTGSAAGNAGGAKTGGAGGRGPGGAGTGGTSAAGTGGHATGGSDAGEAGSGSTTSFDAGCAGAGCDADASVSDVGLPACSQVTTLLACNMRADCHSVFVPTGCELDAGHTCERFDRCADGSKANCSGPALCKSLAPICPPGYVVAYTGSCYEGCVRQDECPTPLCPQTAPSHGASCGVVDYSCFYEDCTGAGRTQARCTTGTWSVQTAACAAVTCTGIGVSNLTCASGQACVRTTSSGGAYLVTPSCVANNCGTAPVSTQCIQGASGCSLSTSLSGVQVNCSAPSSCSSGSAGCPP